MAQLVAFATTNALLDLGEILLELVLNLGHLFKVLGLLQARYLIATIFPVGSQDLCGFSFIKFTSEIFGLHKVLRQKSFHLFEDDRVTWFGMMELVLMKTMRGISQKGGISLLRFG